MSPSLAPGQQLQGIQKFSSRIFQHGLVGVKRTPDVVEQRLAEVSSGRGRGSKSEAACAKFNSGGKTIYLPVGDSDTLRPGLEVLSGRESRREDAYDEVNAGHEAIPLIAPNSTSGGSCCSMRCSLI